MKTQLDRTDTDIIRELQINARLSNKELAARVGLAPSSCLERVRKLQQNGVLRGFHAEVDATALGVDEMFVVLEPSQTSIETAQRVKNLSADIGIKNLCVIGNKIQSQDERQFLEENLRGFDILGYIEYSEEIRKINLRKATALSISGPAVENVNSLLSQGGWLN